MAVFELEILPPLKATRHFDRQVYSTFLALFGSVLRTIVDRVWA